MWYEPTSCPFFTQFRPDTHVQERSIHRTWTLVVLHHAHRTFPHDGQESTRILILVQPQEHCEGVPSGWFNHSVREDSRIPKYTHAFFSPVQGKCLLELSGGKWGCLPIVVLGFLESLQVPSMSPRPVGSRADPLHMHWDPSPGSTCDLYWIAELQSVSDRWLVMDIASEKAIANL